MLIGRCREQRSPAGTISFSPSYGSAGRFAYVTATGLGGPSGFGKGAPTGAAVGLWESTFRVGINRLDIGQGTHLTRRCG